MVKVSIIVPVYNVENYLRDCLDSIINQTLKDIEIICVDDCSTDNSYSILEEYSNKDSRIKVFKNECSKGSGVSRNIGIENSIGEYVGFVDSDDYISEDYFENLYQTAKKYNSDISYTLNILYEKQGVSTYYVDYFDKVLKHKKSEGKSKINITNHKYNTKNYFHVVIWNKIFKREFLTNNNLYFSNINARSQDVNFITKILACFPKVSYSHKSVYYYIYRKDSISNCSNDILQNNILALKQFYDIVDYFSCNKRDLLDYGLTIAFNSCFHIFNSCNDKESFYPYIHDFAKKIELEFTNTNYDHSYIKYILIKNAKTYDEYLLSSNIINDLNLFNREKKFILFGFINSYMYYTVYIFCIKISFKKK